MNRTKTVGILGGIDPESSSQFYLDIIKRLKESGRIKSNEDYPHIIINNIPAPALIQQKITSKDLKQYTRGLKDLDYFKPDFIVMVCNTIHIYYDQLTSTTIAPILNLREVVRRHISKSGYKRIFIIGTPGTINSGLFRSSEYSLIEPGIDEQNLLTEAIFKYSTNVRKDEQIAKVAGLCKKHLDFGAELILVACTDLSMMLAKEKLNKINTLDLLFNETIRLITE